MTIIIGRRIDREYMYIRNNAYKCITKIYYILFSDYRVCLKKKKKEKKEIDNVEYIVHLFEHSQRVCQNPFFFVYLFIHLLLFFSFFFPYRRKYSNY